MANITKEERERRRLEAESQGNGDTSELLDAMDDDQAQASDDHVTMVRDPEQYPEPHRAHVHRNEIRNYYPGGWEVENAD